MTKSRIEYCDYTWNPITGTRDKKEEKRMKGIVSRFSGDIRLNKMAKKDYSNETREGINLYVLDKAMLNETGKPLNYPFGSEPTFHRYRVDMLERLKMGNNILVGTMGDMFADWVPDEWLEEVLRYCLQFPRHNFLFLTEFPERYKLLKDMNASNIFLGAKVTTGEQMRVATKVFSELSLKFRTFITLDCKWDLDEDSLEYAFYQSDWIIIDGGTLEQVTMVSKIAKQYNCPLFIRDSLKITANGYMKQEYPKELKKKKISEKLEKKLYSECSKCKEYKRKSEMITLLARKKRGEQPKQYGFLCTNCFSEHCKLLNVQNLMEGE